MYEVYGTETKKMLNMLILDILMRYTDEQHHLTQQDIIRILKSDYGVEKIDRRSVKANCLSLYDMGYDISMEDGQGYYMASREFEDAELRILIDSVLFSKSISDSYAKRLIEKLMGLGNKYFDTKVSNVKTTPLVQRTDNKQVLFTVSAINDALDKKKKISFRYNKYGTDFKMHDQGRDYIVSPFQMVASNGRYYLLGNNDIYDDISYFRIDKMTDVKILEEKAKPAKDVKGLGDSLNLSKHLAEHIYMFCGESLNVVLKTDVGMMDTLVDWFGKDFRILEEKGNELKVAVRCNENAIFYWALQYGASVEVLEPRSLREDLAKTINDMVLKYSK